MAKKKPSAGKSKAGRTAASSRKSTAKSASKAGPTKRGSKAKSVDGILKSFEKERLTLNTGLTAARKKIEQLTKKIASLKVELEGVKKEVVESELAIETLDARRDKEIGMLLSGMGVDLGKAAAAAKPKAPVDRSTPLFDKKPKPASKAKSRSQAEAEENSAAKA